VIREEDVPKLLDPGRKNIYVWNLEKGFVHENKAAQRIAGPVKNQENWKEVKPVFFQQ